MKINNIIGNVHLEKTSDRLFKDYNIHIDKFKLEIYILYIHNILIVAILSTNIKQIDLEIFEKLDSPIMIIAPKMNFHIRSKNLINLAGSIFIAIIEVIRFTSIFDSKYKSLDRKVLLQSILIRLKKQRKHTSKNKLKIHKQITNYLDDNNENATEVIDYDLNSNSYFFKDVFIDNLFSTILISPQGNNFVRYTS